MRNAELRRTRKPHRVRQRTLQHTMLADDARQARWWLGARGARLDTAADGGPATRAAGNETETPVGNDDLAERTVRECVRAFNRGTVDWVDTYYSEDAEWNELPTPGRPRGRGGTRAVFRAAAEAALTLFPDRQMTIRNLVAGASHVAAELDWEGTAAGAIGNIAAGTKVRLRLASFFAVRDGLIVGQTDYCLPAPAE
jgi:ketosteroid isomerase-like protein